MLFVIKRLFYKGLVMTEDTFKIAEQIKKDIQILKQSSMSKCVSIRTYDNWVNWVNATIAELEKEFKNL